MPVVNTMHVQLKLLYSGFSSGAPNLMLPYLLKASQPRKMKLMM